MVAVDLEPNPLPILRIITNKSRAFWQDWYFIVVVYLGIVVVYFKIIAISRYEAESLGYHFAIAVRLVVFLSSSTSFLVLHPLLFPCPPNPPPGICRMHGVQQLPPPHETAKIQNNC